MERPLSPEDSLSLIESMIYKTRSNLGENRFYFLFWGWVAFSALVLQFLLKVAFAYKQHYQVWWVIVPAVIVTILYSRKHQRSGPRSYVGDFMTYLWSGIGASFFVLSFIISHSKEGFYYAYPFFIMFYGLGTYISGRLLQFRPLIIGGIVNWILAIACVYVAYDYQMLLTAGALMTSYIIPGYLLGVAEKTCGMNEQPMTEQESLRLISEMIGKAKKNVHETGLSAILWGSVIAMCGLGNFATLYWDFDPGFDVWLLALAAIVPQVIINRIERKRRTAKTHNQIALNVIWQVYGLSIFALMFYFHTAASATTRELATAGTTLIAQTKDGNEPFDVFVPSIGSLLLLLYAIPTLATGVIHHFRPMLIGAIICYICFIVSCYVPTTYDMLLNGIAGIANWLVPGIILRRRYLREKRSRHV